MLKYGVPIVDFFIPGFCPSCKTKLPPRTLVCRDCLRQIKIADQKRILSEYTRKFSGSGVIKHFTSCFVFEKDKNLQHIIHSLKYEKKFLLGVYLGTLLGETVARNFDGYKIDLIVPVPLHHLKKAEREFNQSDYIARGVSRVTGIKIHSRLIKRKRYTESQTTMNISERENNTRGAFVPKKRLKGESVLIIDDVITTGSTVKECGRILMDAGAGSVYAASVAIAD